MENSTKLDDYQSFVKETAIFPREMKIIYPTLGLCGESGEVAEKIKKVIRDNNGEFDEVSKVNIIKELGDVLWYLTAIASDLDVSLETIFTANMEKLRDRRSRGMTKGSGDNR